jgi:hypothetical protein
LPVQKQSPADRSGTEVSTVHDPARDDGAHRVAMPAAVASDPDHKRLKASPYLPQAVELSFPKAMADETQSMSRGARSGGATRAAPGARPLHGGRVLHPNLTSMSE